MEEGCRGRGRKAGKLSPHTPPCREVGARKEGRETPVGGIGRRNEFKLGHLVFSVRKMQRIKTMGITLPTSCCVGPSGDLGVGWI